jgi:FkbH-like protein
LSQLAGSGEFRDQRIALLASAIIDPVPNLLSTLLLRDGTLPETRLAGFNQWQLELRQGAPAFAGLNPRLVACLLDDSAVFERVRDELDLDEVEQRLDDFAIEMADWVALSQRTLGGLTVLCTIPLSPLRRDRLIDYRSKARLDSAWHRMNSRLLELGASGSTLVLSHEALATRAGAVFAQDRLRHVAHHAFSVNYLHAYAEELSRVSRADLGQAAKTLVLDLDNTLWGGVVGDDGVAGLQLGGAYPGSAHTEVQSLARDLGLQGVLLTVCSKNDDSVAREAIDSHPEMVLRGSDLVAVRANWQPKPDNIAELAGELNLGVDSMVFLDDSPFEREHMRRLQPEVRTIALSQEPATYATTLAASGQFNTLRLTSDDLVRTDQYQAQARRSQSAASATTTEQYLLELGSAISVEPLGDHNADRIVQLFAKTNQFNLTGRRYGTEQIAQMRGDGHGAAFGIRLTDNFGDNGLIAAVAVDLDESGHWCVGNFVLSCRAFSRNVEGALLTLLLTAARDSGVPGVRATFTQTAKNAKFADFYLKLGFTPGVVPGSFLHDLSQIPAMPAWIRSSSNPEVFHVS